MANGNTCTSLATLVFNIKTDTSYTHNDDFDILFLHSLEKMSSIPCVLILWKNSYKIMPQAYCKDTA